MKKAVNFVICLLMIIACVFSTVGCGAGEISNSENDLVISVWKNGSMRESTINKLVEAFNAKYPQYNVVLDVSGDMNVFANNIGLGERYNPYDLFFTNKPGIDTSSKYLENLENILTDNNNENLNKFEPTILDSIRNESGFYYLPYVNNWLGIVYDANIIDGQKYSVPRTTDEFASLVSLILNDGTISATPFIHFKTEGYWEQLYPVWQAQYEGLDYYKDNFLMLKDEHGQSPSFDVATRKDGRFEVMKVLDSLINDKTVYPGSNNADYSDAQVKFLGGRAVMMVNGTWLQNEMGAYSKDKNIKMMKIPVISSITNRTTDIDNDEELQSLISAIDAAGSDKSSIPLTGNGYEVCQSDIDIVYEARNYTPSICDDNVICIPNYANAKEIAKLFVKFMFEDAQIKLYANESHLPLPYKVSYTKDLADTSSYSSFEHNIEDLRESSIPIIAYSYPRHDLFTKGGATDFGTISVVSAFTTAKGSRQTSSQLWDQLTSVWRDNWSLYLRNAGLQ